MIGGVSLMIVKSLTDVSEINARKNYNINQFQQEAS